MRFFVAILLLSASAFGQEGIPVNIGMGKLQPGLDQPTQGTYVQVANRLPNIDGVIVIDINRVNWSPEFAHIADGLTLPQFIKKIAFAMNPGLGDQWPNDPKYEIVELFAATTSRIAIIKGPSLGNFCLVLECKVDRDVLINAIESGWNTDYTEDQR